LSCQLKQFFLYLKKLLYHIEEKTKVIPQNSISITGYLSKIVIIRPHILPPAPIPVVLFDSSLCSFLKIYLLSTKWHILCYCKVILLFCRYYLASLEKLFSSDLLNNFWCHKKVNKNGVYGMPFIFISPFCLEPCVRRKNYRVRHVYYGSVGNSS
jgi:hypothetical protein